MGRLAIDLTGKKFGRLTVVRRVESKSSKARWLCRCDCGVDKEVCGCMLRSGNTRSCGCFQKESARANQTKHGLKYHPLYAIHTSLVRRCTSHNDPSYHNYGGRGITVCDEWLDKESGLRDFVEWAEKNGYEKGLEIDRRDNDGNYEPSNCRFVTRCVNSRNKRKRVDNTSGYVGVIYNKSSGKWKSEISINKRRIVFGYFDYKKQAVEARNNYIIENGLTEYKIQEYKD